MSSCPLHKPFFFFFFSLLYSGSLWNLGQAGSKFLTNIILLRILRKILLLLLIDDDECYSANAGCEQLCINTPGSYHCSCRSGYTKIGHRCEGMFILYFGRNYSHWTSKLTIYSTCRWLCSTKVATSHLFTWHVLTDCPNPNQSNHKLQTIFKIIWVFMVLNFNLGGLRMD